MINFLLYNTSIKIISLFTKAVNWVPNYKLENDPHIATFFLKFQTVGWENNTLVCVCKNICVRV